MKKTLLFILAFIIIIIIGFVIFVSISGNKNFDAPLPEITARKDSSIIARGKYLAFGPAHCSYCHVPMDKILEVDAGLELPLIGGWELRIPPGKFRAQNITPDTETGIGNISDAQLARALRYSVTRNNKFIIPVMPFQELSDDDLTAIISFLRSQEPVQNKVEPSKLTFLGKMLLAVGALKPQGPETTPPKSVKIDSTAEYGKYIANYVANCHGCHTERNLKSGAFIGKPFAGGMKFPPESISQGYFYISPNITPDESSGTMVHWDEATFTARFRAGRVHQGSPMPWGAISRMTDIELKALYNYLQTVEPVNNKIDKTVFPPGEKFPEE